MVQIRSVTRHAETSLQHATPPRDAIQALRAYARADRHLVAAVMALHFDCAPSSSSAICFNSTATTCRAIAALY